MRWDHRISNSKYTCTGLLLFSILFPQTWGNSQRTLQKKVQKIKAKNLSVSSSFPSTTCVTHMLEYLFWWWGYSAEYALKDEQGKLSPGNCLVPEPPPLPQALPDAKLQTPGSQAVDDMVAWQDRELKTWQTNMPYSGCLIYHMNWNYCHSWLFEGGLVWVSTPQKQE